ncbi:MAG: glycosyltransferase family 2 protein [Rhodospirillales bacterium]|nr:glycosyltransferase family 2 protein [Rhodospirillales bacterium]
MSIDISVIIATYNVESYIERAIQSALTQESVDLEVIVVDDRSTDGTLAVAQAISDPRVKCLQLPENGGPGAARNAGIAVAGGNWIAVLDGDDAYAPGRLRRCLDRAAQAKADIVVDNLLICPETDTDPFPMFPAARLAEMKTLDLAAFIRGKLDQFSAYTLGYLKPVFAAAFLKRHDLSYPLDIRNGEDYLLLAESLACGAVCAIDPAAGYLYTARTGSVSHRLSSDDVARVLTGDERFLARHALETKAKKAQQVRTFQLRDMHAFCLMVESIKQRDFSGAMQAALRRPTAIRFFWMPVWARIKKGTPKCLQD